MAFGGGMHFGVIADAVGNGAGQMILIGRRGEKFKLRGVRNKFGFKLAGGHLRMAQQKQIFGFEPPL